MWRGRPCRQTYGDRSCFHASFIGWSLVHIIAFLHGWSDNHAVRRLLVHALRCFPESVEFICKITLIPSSLRYLILFTNLWFRHEYIDWRWLSPIHHERGRRRFRLWLDTKQMLASQFKLFHPEEDIFVEFWASRWTYSHYMLLEDWTFPVPVGRHDGCWDRTIWYGSLRWLRGAMLFKAGLSCSILLLDWYFGSLWVPFNYFRSFHICFTLFFQTPFTWTSGVNLVFILTKVKSLSLFVTRADSYTRLLSSGNIAVLSCIVSRWHVAFTALTCTVLVPLHFIV